MLGADGLDYNCVTLKNFNGPGDVEYWPGRKLALGAALLDSWLRHGYVRLLGPEDVEPKEEKQKPSKKRTVRATTAVTK